MANRFQAIHNSISLDVYFPCIQQNGAMPSYVRELLPSLTYITNMGVSWFHSFVAGIAEPSDEEQKKVQTYFLLSIIDMDLFLDEIDKPKNNQ